MVELVFVGIFALFGVVVLPRVWLHTVHNTREAMSAAIEFRAPTDADAKYVKALDGEKVRAQALTELGFERLGDIVYAIRATGRVQVVVRAFVDPPQKTCAFVAVAYGTGAVMFESYTDTQELVSSYSRADAYIEAGPTSTRQFLHASKLSIAEAYRKHQELAAEATVTMTNLDEVIAAARAAHERLIAWRETQPADTLLERDLRKLLTWQYRLYGRWIAKRIQTLPRASIHR